MIRLYACPPFAQGEPGNLIKSIFSIIYIFWKWDLSPASERRVFVFTAAIVFLGGDLEGETGCVWFDFRHSCVFPRRRVVRICLTGDTCGSNGNVM